MNRDKEESQKTSSSFSLTKIALGIAACLAVALLVFRFTCVTFIENYELGFTYNKMSGKIQRLERTGYVVTLPLVVSVHTIDLRPVQVRVEANSRVLNTKLVKFNPEGLEKFVEWHGRKAADKYSFSGGAKDNRLEEILRSYAFDVQGGASCPFLTVLDEAQKRVPTNNTNIPTHAATQLERK